MKRHIHGPFVSLQEWGNCHPAAVENSFFCLGLTYLLGTASMVPELTLQNGGWDRRTKQRLDWSRGVVPG